MLAPIRVGHHVIEFEVREANRPAEVLFGAPQRGLTGRRIGELFDDPRAAGAEIVRLAAALEDGVPVQEEIRGGGGLAAEWLLHHALPSGDRLAVTLLTPPARRARRQARARVR